jgi:hypothetical protein
MLIDLTKPLKTLKGEDLKEHGEAVTLGGVVCSIIAALPADAGIPASERQKRFVLSVRIAQAARAIDIDQADASLMIKLINASALPPLFSEQIVCALEDKPNPLEKPAGR